MGKITGKEMGRIKAREVLSWIEKNI